MQKLIQVTEDGSHTLEIPEMGVTYHSMHGAIAESMHVYIDAGLNYLAQQKKITKIRILEMGFGTGLNALLSLRWAKEKKIFIEYTSLELDPLTQLEYSALNYGENLNLNHELIALHDAEWNLLVKIDPFFSLEKVHIDLQVFESLQKFDCIFFDAFSPSKQPELWTTEIFRKLWQLMESNAILVTYCSKSVVRKMIQEAGFEITKIPGPRGKREMVRATRLL